MFELKTLLSEELHQPTAIARTNGDECGARLVEINFAPRLNVDFPTISLRGNN